MKTKNLIKIADTSFKNNGLEQSIFSLSIMLRLNRSDILQTIEKHFHLKDNPDKMDNPGRNQSSV